jgi:hypothetical protein
MKALTVALLVAVAALALQLNSQTANGQVLTDADLNSAIAAGASKKYDHLVVECVASTGMKGGFKAGFGKDVETLTPFDVTVAGNAGQVALLAANAKRLYKPFTIADVPEELRNSPAVYVVANPRRPGALFGRVVAATPIERIVLKSQTQPAVVIEPASFEEEPVTFNGPKGGTIESTRGHATFPLAAVKALPSGNVEIVIVTADAERKCHIDDGERKRLLGPK